MSTTKISWADRAKLCLGCGRPIARNDGHYARARYCSRTCFGASLIGKALPESTKAKLRDWNKGRASLERNPNWKGGRSVASNGYMLIKRPGHPNADSRGYVYEHRLIASEILGRPLLAGEIAHHLNVAGDKTDNRSCNIEPVASQGLHQLRHRSPKSDRRLPSEVNPPLGCACGCGTTFLKYDESGRPRRYISGHNARRQNRDG